MSDLKVDLSGTELIVKFEGVKLAKDEALHLSRVIQKAVLQELPSLKVGGQVSAMLPKEWLGIWLDKIGTKRIVPNITTAAKG